MFDAGKGRGLRGKRQVARVEKGNVSVSRIKSTVDVKSCTVKGNKKKKKVSAREKAKNEYGIG